MLHKILKSGSIMEKDTIILKNVHQILRIPIESIVFIEKQSGKLYIHSYLEIYEAKGNLSDIEKRGYPLFRSHRSFIVNLYKIKSVVNTGDRVYKVTFVDYDKPAWMSRGNYKQYLRLFNRGHFKLLQ